MELLRFNYPWWIYWLFSRYRWFRRFAGGHWERWWNDVTHTAMWEHLNFCTQTGIEKEKGTRPPCSFGSPECENW